MFLTIYTLIHVVISLLGIAAGFVVIYSMLTAKPLEKWTAFFLATTTATSVTGFFFPFEVLKPAYVFGVISLVALAAAYYALRTKQLSGGWRKVYVINTLFAQYLNCFVLVVQSFLKLPPLKALAPTQSEPPFAIAHGALFVLFVIIGFAAVNRFRAVANSLADGNASSR